jgi:transcriptional antiterminator RfaH
MTEKWHVARCKSGKEWTASISVVAKGYPVFLPQQTVKRTIARKTELVSRPLFPRYLFIRFDHETSQFGEINWCRGIANRGLMVNADGVPLSVPDKVIEDVRGRERAQQAKAGETTTGYKPGDVFKIAVGLFASFPATYIGEENGIIFATIEVLGRGHLQEIAFEDVPVSPRVVDNFAA